MTGNVQGYICEECESPLRNMVCPQCGQRYELEPAPRLLLNWRESQLRTFTLCAVLIALSWTLATCFAPYWNH